MKNYAALENQFLVFSFGLINYNNYELPVISMDVNF